MRRELGDHIGKKKGWLLWELGEVAILLVKKWISKRKAEPVKNDVPDEHIPDNKIL